jgi:hypothetical protein
MVDTVRMKQSKLVADFVNIRINKQQFAHVRKKFGGVQW